MNEIHAPQGTKGSWILAGTAGDDALYGGKGDNRFEAGAGNDTLYPNFGDAGGSNECDGGDGVDTVVLGNGFSRWQVDFDAASGTYKAGQVTLKNVEYIDFGDVRLTVEQAANRSGTQHAYTAGDDQLVGNDFGYALMGGEGNDSFTGNGGDDMLYGGKGEDTAVFRGNRADYRIVFDYNDGSFVVTDGQAGRDGQDHLSAIEHLKFADGTIDLAFAKVFPVQPTDASLALIDGVIGTPYVPPPVPDGGGDTVLWIGTATLLNTTAAEAGELQVVLAGASDVRGTDVTGFVLDAS